MALGVLVRCRGRRADRVEAELVAQPLELLVGHPRHCAPRPAPAAESRQTLRRFEGGANSRGRRARGAPLRGCAGSHAGPGEVLIRLRAASLNRLDLWVRRGLPSVPKPRILGADGAGLVEELGAGVEGFAPGDEVVINPGLEHNGRITVIGEHTDGTHAELIAVPAENVYPLSGRPGLRGGRGVPARVRDRVPDARDAGRPPGGRMGARLGCRQRNRHGHARDRPGARRAGARHLLERREAPARCRARGRRRRQPCGRGRRRGGQGGDRWRRCRRRGRARRRGNLAALAPVGARGRSIAVCGATTGPNPPARLHRIWWKQLSILGSTMGTKTDFEGPTSSWRAAERSRSSIPRSRSRSPGCARADGERRPVRQGRPRIPRDAAPGRNPSALTRLVDRRREGAEDAILAQALGIRWAAVAFAAAAFAPAARGGVTSRAAAAFRRSPRLGHQRPSTTDFSWADAGVGAAAAFSIVLSAGGVMVARGTSVIRARGRDGARSSVGEGERASGPLPRWLDRQQLRRAVTTRPSESVIVAATALRRATHGERPAAVREPLPGRELHGVTQRLSAPTTGARVCFRAHETGA